MTDRKPRTKRTAQGAPRVATAGIVTALVALTGCTVINEYQDPPIVGDWKGKPDTVYVNDKMSLDLDGDGKGTIMHTVAGGTDVHESHFDIDWEYHSTDEYDIEWDCKDSTAGSCGGLDFTLRCDINGDGDELDCEDRSNVWTVPEVDWVDD
jgi:hypothetical protein